MFQTDSNLIVKDICKQRGLTLKELADRIGIAPEALTRSVSSHANPTLSTLQKIAEGLGLEVKDLFAEKAQSVSVSGHIECDGVIYSIKSLEELKSLANKLDYQLNNK